MTDDAGDREGKRRREHPELKRVRQRAREFLMQREVMRRRPFKKMGLFQRLKNAVRILTRKNGGRNV